MSLEAVPFVAVPVGWMPCVACSDFTTQPGTMWLGRSSTGADITIACPACHGTGQVPRMKHIDIRTGHEIDYEKPGQRFIYSGDVNQPSAEQPRNRIILA